MSYANNMPPNQSNNSEPSTDTTGDARNTNASQPEGAVEPGQDAGIWIAQHAARINAQEAPPAARPTPDSAWRPNPAPGRIPIPNEPVGRGVAQDIDNPDFEAQALRMYEAGKTPRRLGQPMGSIHANEVVRDRLAQLRRRPRQCDRPLWEQDEFADGLVSFEGLLMLEEMGYILIPKNGRR